MIGTGEDELRPRAVAPDDAVDDVKGDTAHQDRDGVGTDAAATIADDGVVGDQSSAGVDVLDAAAGAARHVAIDAVVGDDGAAPHDQDAAAAILEMGPMGHVVVEPGAVDDATNPGHREATASARDVAPDDAVANLWRVHQRGTLTFPQANPAALDARVVLDRAILDERRRRRGARLGNTDAAAARAGPVATHDASADRRRRALDAYPTPVARFERTWIGSAGDRDPLEHAGACRTSRVGNGGPRIGAAVDRGGIGAIPAPDRDVLASDIEVLAIDTGKHQHGVAVDRRRDRALNRGVGGRRHDPRCLRYAQAERQRECEPDGWLVHGDRSDSDVADPYPTTLVPILHPGANWRVA